MGKRRGAHPALRLISLLTAMAVALVAIGGRLVQLQVVKASAFENLGTRQRIRRVEIPARRGTIYDRNGVPLAVSVDARAIYANPQFVSDPVSTAREISAVLHIPARVLEERLRRRSGFVYLARKLDVPVAQRAIALNLPGIGSLEESKRVYPQGALAGQVLGFVGTDDVGLAGVELRFDRVLRGQAGEQILEQDPRGRPIPHGRSSLHRPVRGDDITLTIDRDLQYETERALQEAMQKTGARDGTAMVTDPRTNEILAMASWPPFDPNRFAEQPPERARNRAAQDAYEPGSVTKLVTAAAALQSGLVRPSDTLTIPDSLRIADHVAHDFKNHGTLHVSYAEALARSSNIGTLEVALKIGARRVYDMLERFGFGHRTGVEFPGESAGISLPLAQWSGTSIATIPIGQGIAASLLQMMNVYGTVARDGMWTVPHLIRSIDGRSPPDQTPPHRVVSTYTAAQLRGMLLNVVENGTGRSARIPGYLIGGKTGTAHKPLVGARGYSDDVETTFIGMAPVDRPRFVTGVVLDAPSIHMAAVTAAPAFQRIMSFALARWGVQPERELSAGDVRAALTAAATPRPAPRPTPVRANTPTPSASGSSTGSPHPSAHPSASPSSTSSPSPSPHPSHGPHSSPP